MGNLACPNCGGKKWQPHGCKQPECCWQLCMTCHLIVDILTRRAAINDQQNPLFIQL